MNMWRPAGIAGKFINLSAMLDNTVIIIMFIKNYNWREIFEGNNVDEAKYEREAGM